MKSKNQAKSSKIQQNQQNLKLSKHLIKIVCRYQISNFQIFTGNLRIV